MRNLVRLLIVLAVLGSGGFARAGQDEDKAELRDLEKRCSEALVSADIPFLASFYADGWVLIGSDGERYGRQHTLALLSIGTVKWKSCDCDDLEVQVFGDTAFVIYKATARGEVPRSEDRGNRDLFRHVHPGGRPVALHSQP